MKIAKHIEAELRQEQRGICELVLSTCEKYPENINDAWVSNVLLYSLETYLRINQAIDESGGKAWDGFVLAHQMPPVLPNHVMEIASRAMRKLTFDDANNIISFTEQTAIWYREFGGPTRDIPFSKAAFTLRAVHSLVDVLMKDILSNGRQVAESTGTTNHSKPISQGNDVWSRGIGASAFSKTSRKTSHQSAHGIIFVTLRTDERFLTDEPISHPEATVFNEGNLHSGLFSPYGFARGSWRLTVHFSVFNNTDSQCVVYDIHAKVYNRLKEKPGVLATTGYRMAVELSADNSILGKHAPAPLDSGDCINVALAVDASLFETLQTTVVFGLLVDCYSVTGGTPTKLTIPSDALYVFQHARQMGTKCHFVSRTSEEINSRLTAQQSNSELQQTYRALQAIFNQHKGPE